MANVGSAAAGKTLIGNGNGASPTYASIGTNSGLTAHGVVISEGSGAFVATSVGTSGQVLTSNGPGLDPTFQTAASGGVTTINGDSGSITGSSVTIFANQFTQNCGSSVSFNNTGTTSTFNVTDSHFNTMFGKSCGNASISGSSNTYYGYQAGLHLGSGNGNSFFGQQGGLNIVSGQYCTGMGFQAGVNWDSSDSSNISIIHPGASGDNNKLYIGIQGSGLGQQNACRIAGITGSTVTAGSPVYVDSSGNLGTVSTTPGFNCAFSAFLPSTDSNVTGDNTSYSLGSGNALTEQYDLGGNFSTAGVFTAPANGVYSFVINMYLGGIGALHNSFAMRLTTSGPSSETFVSSLNCFPIIINTDNCMINGSVQIQLSAGQTAAATIVVAGSTKTINVIGFNGGLPSYFTYFSGCRVA